MRVIPSALSAKVDWNLHGAAKSKGPPILKVENGLTPKPGPKQPGVFGQADLYNKKGAMVNINKDKWRIPVNKQA